MGELVWWFAGLFATTLAAGAQVEACGACCKLSGALVLLW
jgi:hypothetical protein